MYELNLSLSKFAHPLYFFITLFHWYFHKYFYRRKHHIYSINCLTLRVDTYLRLERALNMFVKKYTLISGFLAFLDVTVLGKVLI